MFGEAIVELAHTQWGLAASDRLVDHCFFDSRKRYHAAELSSALIQAVGLREQGASELGDAAQMRARAYSLFVGTYNEIRRAVAYLRGSEGDVDSIIPSQGRAPKALLPHREPPLRLRLRLPLGARYDYAEEGSQG